MPSRRKMLLRLFVGVLLLMLVLALVGPGVLAQEGGPAAGRLASAPELPASLAELKLDSPLSASNVVPMNKINKTLQGATGTQQVVVRLAENPVAEVAEAGGDASAQQNQLNNVVAQQDQVVDAVLAIDPTAEILGSAQVATNVVAIEIDAAGIEELAARPDVVAINPVFEYELALSETVPYIGGTAAHDLGFTGAGVRVAVLDSGIDYTHAALGGPGTLEAYQAAYGVDPSDPANTTTDGLFPTAKVIGGYDFVGETWGGSDDPLEPDPDPIDYEGHGTNVADIIAGLNGVAPDASLYALKVCSAVTSSCNGVALLQAMDFAMDPNGDGDTGDHVDIINMSLGSPYGQSFDDDLSVAVNNATAVGILSVVSAGNSGDKPYIVGSPSSAFTALSVAQTEVPSAVQDRMEIVAPEAIAGLYTAIWQSWSASLTGVLEGPAQYGDGAGGNLLGCDPFEIGSLSDRIVLVDRGVCSFSIKIANIAEAGGMVGIIAQNTDDPPFPGGFGGGDPFVPGYMIGRADGTLIKNQINAGETVTVRFDPANGISVIGTVVSTSSRGPAMQTNFIKPEIGAPGASVSAEVGTGNGTVPFGGTSGAAPMVSGAAALLVEAYPDRSPLEIKTALINTGDTDIMNTPELAGGELAPVSRIGGGEVRVDQAITTPAVAFDAMTRNAALSFGFRDIILGKTVLNRVVAVRNYSNRHILYRVSSDFRFADDNTGAVQVKTPPFVWAPKNRTSYFMVTMVIDGKKLQDWAMDSGPNGGNADILTQFEYDGYVNLDDFWSIADNDNPIHLPWHVLPRLSGNILASTRTVPIGPDVDPDYGIPTGSVDLRNVGIGEGRVDAYSLIATSPNLPEGGLGENSPIIDLRYVGVATYPVPAGYCSADESFVMAFAVNTWERQTHANAPAIFFIDIDIDQDGVFDYEIYNTDEGGPNVTWAVDLSTFDATASFYTEHGTNSGNTVLMICGEQIGMNAGNFFQPMDIEVGAFDGYFVGTVTDLISDITIAPLGERYLGMLDGDIPFGQTKTLTVLDFGPVGTNPGELGLLLLLDASRGTIRGGAPFYNEALGLKVVPSVYYDVTPEPPVTEEVPDTSNPTP
ncbi:MAG: S8 family serine peptidase [Anaerolineae bacterium]|nr:S8 family serine peptidase [Anaerolineae bacterium]